MAAYWVFAKTHRSWAEIRWSLINICTSVILLASLLFVSSLSWVSPPGRLELGVAVICVGRTIADYWWSWACYFPKR